MIESLGGWRGSTGRTQLPFRYSGCRLYHPSCPFVHINYFQSRVDMDVIPCEPLPQNLAGWWLVVEHWSTVRWQDCGEVRWASVSVYQSRRRAMALGEERYRPTFCSEIGPEHDVVRSCNREARGALPSNMHVVTVNHTSLI